MTSLHYDMSRGPVLKRETVKVARLVSLDGIGPRDHVLRFEREALTVRETQAFSVTVIGGISADVGTTHNDFYGFLTSPRHVLDEARDYAKRAGLTIGGATRREVVLRIIDRRLLASNRREEDQVRYGGTEYLIPPSDWLLDDEALPPFLAEIAKAGRDRSFDVQPNAVAAGNGEVREVVIWRSDEDEDANRQRFAEAVAGAFEGVSSDVPWPGDLAAGINHDQPRVFTES